MRKTVNALSVKLLHDRQAAVTYLTQLTYLTQQALYYMTEVTL